MSSNPITKLENTTPRQKFGLEVRAARMAIGISQSQARFVVGVSQPALSMIELGDSRVSTDLLELVARWFKLPAPQIARRLPAPYGPQPRFRVLESYEPEPLCGAYVILNLINGKAYVGRSRDVRSRWSDHSLGSASNKKLQRDVEAFGHSAFVFIPAYYGSSPKTAEATLIGILDSVRTGYNVMPSTY